MFHCSYIHKWSLVVCRFWYCTELSQNSCAHLLRSACELFVCCSARRRRYHIHGPCECLARIHCSCECSVHFRHEYTYCTMNIVHLITVLDLGLFSVCGLTSSPVGQLLSSLLYMVLAIQKVKSASGSNPIVRDCMLASLSNHSADIETGLQG